jgi:RhtB (resistance to homoserine/threonine) family protein
MTYLPEFLTVAVIHLLAVMSPGPDFVMISRNSVVHSRRTGVYSAIGVSLGIPVHITYCLIGIALIISRSLVLFSALKFAGAGYLIYIGYRSVRAKAVPVGAVEAGATPRLSPPAAVWIGFLTNVLNPKASLFFFALFTQVISPHTPRAILVLYGVEMSVMTFAWFAFVATLLTHSLVRARFVRIQPQLERVFGVLLIALGVKVACFTAR